MLIEKPYRVAVIDDDVLMLRFYEKALSKIEGIEAKFFSNAVEALHHIEKNNVRIVLSDIRMPQMGGYQLLQECLDLNLGITFYAVTGTDSVILANDCLKAGARGFLRKPVEVQTVRDVIQAGVKFYDTWNDLINGIARDRGHAS